MHRSLWFLTLAACTTPPAPPAVQRQVVTMGTVLRVVASAATPTAASAAAEAAVAAVLADEQRWSSWRPDSQLSRLHATPVGQPCPVDDAFRRGLAAALQWVARTDGAFDPTIGRWLGAEPAPDATGRQPGSGFRIAAAAVVRTSDGRLAEGGFAKGLALDAAIAASRRQAAVAVDLDLGGQLAWWQPAAGAPVGVAHPDHRRRVVAHISPPAAGSLATSGTSERGGHILDPRTGRPAPDWGTVTVLCTGSAAATAADCLSTALFVLGPRDGLALAERLPDVEALFVERTDHGLRWHATPGMRARLHPIHSQLQTPRQNPR